jgi:hypothetical protein
MTLNSSRPSLINVSVGAMVFLYLSLAGSSIYEVIAMNRARSPLERVPLWSVPNIIFILVAMIAVAGLLSLPRVLSGNRPVTLIHRTWFTILAAFLGVAVVNSILGLADVITVIIDWPTGIALVALFPYAADWNYAWIITTEAAYLGVALLAAVPLYVRSSVTFSRTASVSPVTPIIGPAF